MSVAFVIVLMGAVQWQHPAGLITKDTIAEVGEKAATQEWARHLLDSKRRAVAKWVDVPYETLESVFPVKRGNVYHNFSCPTCRTRLVFNPFKSDGFHCDTCKSDFAPDIDAGIYPKGDRYNGTMYDGWACMFYQNAALVAVEMGVIGRLDGNEAWLKRGRELLALFVRTAKGLPTVQKGEGDPARIFTYAREGESLILCELAQAYDLLRDGMSSDERAAVERDLLTRMLDDIMMQPIYTFDHNNIYRYHWTILQTAVALEREDLLDWSYGYGEFSPEKQPDHRSLQRIVAKHFKPDGAFWELCSGYHLYPMDAFCHLAVVAHNISRMDPARFPAQQYDYTDPGNPGGKAIKAALEWFVSMAMPDRSMTIVGDSPVPRAGMDSYDTTAEVGYRYFDVRAVGDYEVLRQGKRTWGGLLLGAPQIVQKPTPFTSSYLSSGWVSLRSDWNGNRVWAGLNAMIPGGGHQHADRLTFTLYSQDTLLALEKGCPYNELAIRELATFSQAHNTVTVDMATQKQGEALKGEEIPEAAVFFDAPFLKYTEVHGDHIYPQTSVYRRGVAVIEDVVLDVFRVAGGKTHDWMVNHAGGPPTLSCATEAAPFEPAQWLANGTTQADRALCDGDWTAQWTVSGVSSRLTMMGSKETAIYKLQTYPIDNAVITPAHPPCETLCVRRTDDTPFVAVWDAWRDAPNLQSVTRVPDTDALVLRTRAHVYHILFGPGKAVFSDGVEMESDAAFSVVKDEKAAALSGGTRLNAKASQRVLRVELNERGNAWADWSEGEAKRGVAPLIQHDTYGGVDHPREGKSVTVAVHAEGM